MVKTSKLVAQESGMGMQSVREIAKRSGAARWVGRKLFIDTDVFYGYINSELCTKGNKAAAAPER